MKSILDKLILWIMWLSLGLFIIFLFSPNIILQQKIVQTAFDGSVTSFKYLSLFFSVSMFVLLVGYIFKGTNFLKKAALLSFLFSILGLRQLLFHRFSVLVLVIMVILLLITIVFGWIIIKYPAAEDFTDKIHPDFKDFSFFVINFKPLWRKKIINKILDRQYSRTTITDEIKITEYQIEGYENRPIRLEVFELNDADKDSPCMIVYPGGAYWAGPLSTYKYFFSRYIKGTKVKIVFVHYTLSVEAPYPAAHEDCYIGTLWCYENAHKLGIDNQNIVLYGISTGGTLATGVSMMLRDRKQFKPRLQMMIYPMFDHKMNSASALKYKTMAGWKDEPMLDLLEYYMKGFVRPYPVYAFPIYSKDLSNLPDAYIEAAEFDAVRDQAKNYAKKLKKAGNNVNLSEIKGAVHGFDLKLKSDITKAQFEKRIKFLNKIFNS